MNKSELTELQTKLVEALKSYETTRAREIIRIDASVLTFRNNENYAALDILADSQSIAGVEWLCREMKAKHLSIDAYGNDDMTALQRAYLLGNHKILNILIKYTNEPHLKEWFVKRQLVSIFGSNALQENNLYVNSRLASIADAGSAIEASQIFASAMSKFAQSKKNYADIVKYVINFQENSQKQFQQDYDPSDLIRQADSKPDQRVLFQSGYQQHGFICGLKKNTDGTYQLSIYDDNEMSFSPRHTLLFCLFGDIAFVRRINIAAADLREVINVLAKNFDTTSATMLQWIDNLPSALHSRFHYDNRITYNLYSKEPERCFWNNPQHAILDYFIDTLGEEVGKRDFAEFIIFIKEQALNNFKEAFADRYNLVATEKLEHIIAKDKINTASPKNPAKKILIGVSILLGLASIALGIIIPLSPVFAALISVLAVVLLAPLPVIYFAKIAVETTTRFLRICLGIGTPLSLTRDEKISVTSSYRHIRQIMPTVTESPVETTPALQQHSSGPLFTPVRVKPSRFNRRDDNVDLWPLNAAVFRP